MKLIELTETQYRNYSRIHKEKNYCQTVEYTNLLEKKKNNKNYIDLISDIVNILNKYNFVATDYTNKFSKYDLVVESKKNLNDIYNSFNSNTKRNIRNSIYMGITIEKANDNELDTFYEMAKKCTKQSISFLKNYLTSYSTPDNAMEVYYAKLKADVYINNYRHLLAKEQERNRNLNNNLQNNNSKKRNKTISRKMESDRLIEKYNNEIIKGTNLLKKYPNGIILYNSTIHGRCEQIIYISYSKMGNN